jgi:urease accessory protein
VSASIIILGLLVALAVKAPVWLGAVLVGLFAFFHGHAHGTEAVAASLVAYGAGFAIATAGLHAAGIGLALTVEGSIGKPAVQAMGVLTVLGGLALIGA